MKRLSNDRWREWLRSPVTLHVSVVVILSIVVLYLGARLGMDWSATDSSSSNALASKQMDLKALTLQTHALYGLDKRVDVSRGEITKFYADRIPTTYSSIATRIGQLQVASGVQLSRVQYAQGPPGTDLTEITMDAGISGNYPQIMRFVNGLERDKTFFVIRAMALTGQQGGLVNLRIRFSTWMRASDAAHSGISSAQSSDSPKSGGAVSHTEGE